MKRRELVREALATLVSQRIPTLLVLILAAAMCVTALTTVGRSARAEQLVLSRIEAAGSRTLQVRDVSRSGLITAQVIATMATFSSVDRAIGLSVAVDATPTWSGGQGAKIVTWTLIGNPSDALTLVAGREPGPGEAVVSLSAAKKLGLDGPAGSVSIGVRDVPIVGLYQAREPFTDLDAGIVVAAFPDAVASSLTIVASSYQETPALLPAVLSVIAPPSTQDLTVSAPQVLADIQAAVGQDLGDFSRSLLVIVLVAGAGLIAVVVLADLLIRRYDLGRRRALGITRGDLVALVAVRTTVTALLGAVVGVIVGTAICARMGAIPPPAFVLATAILTMVAALVAAIPPALHAATRDPVTILRTA